MTTGIADRFKRNLMNFLAELQELTDNNLTLSLAVDFTSTKKPEQLFQDFIDTLDIEQNDGKTLREHHHDKNFHRILQIMSISLTNTLGVDLSREISTMDSDTEEIIFANIDSFFNLEKEKK
jgi:hypothetical protein